MGRNRLNLVGNKYHKLTVVEFAGLDIRRNSRWKCRCDCGNETIKTGCNLKSGRLKTCGCEAHARRVETRAEDHPDFRVFLAMLARCYTPSTPSYGSYGGRGVKVCDRWREGGFWVFLDDMGPRPTPDHSIDRYPDTAGDYTPENCRWATPKQQANNRRTNTMITYRGETRTMKEWAEALGINYQTLKARIRSGWDIERAMTPEPIPRGLTEGVIDAVLRMAGKPVQVVAREVGIGITSVYRIRRLRGG